MRRGENRAREGTMRTVRAGIEKCRVSVQNEREEGKKRTREGTRYDAKVYAEMKAWYQRRKGRAEREVERHHRVMRYSAVEDSRERLSSSSIGCVGIGAFGASGISGDARG